MMGAARTNDTRLTSQGGWLGCPGTSDTQYVKCDLSVDSMRSFSIYGELSVGEVHILREIDVGGQHGENTNRGNSPYSGTLTPAPSGAASDGYSFPQAPIHTGMEGFPLASPPTSLRRSSTSQPSFSSPNTTYFPFIFESLPSSSVRTTKNCDELVFLPEFAIASVPRANFFLSPALSSLNLPP